MYTLHVIGGLLGSALITFVFTLDPFCICWWSMKANPASMLSFSLFFFAYMYFLIEFMNGSIKFVLPVVDCHTALRRIERAEVSKTESVVVLAEQLFCKLSLSLIHYMFDQSAQYKGTLLYQCDPVSLIMLHRVWVIQV